MYMEKICRDPKISLLTFGGNVGEELVIKITVTTTWSTIKVAGFLLYDNKTEQFDKLWSYGKEVLRVMDGSIVRIKLDEGKFDSIYICPAPLKKGFKDVCRKFICLDGWFLKGSFKGQILAAVGVDGDNGIYPIAWVVVRVENTTTWTWFVHLRRQDLEMDTNADDWVIIIYQQKGLESAIEAKVPHAEHLLCDKHLHANWSKKYPGKAFKDLMWEVARAANVPYFEAAMEKIKSVYVDAYDALNRLNMRKWTMCAFKVGINCHMLVNNCAEAFNICIM